MKYARVIYPTGASCVFELVDLNIVLDEIMDSDAGEDWEIRIIEMDEDEYEALPEFAGA